MSQQKTAQQNVKTNTFSNIHDRVTLVENWLKKPGINADSVIDPDADSASALVAYVIANRDFEVLGTSATTATVTFADGGGITLTTLTTANDSVIVLPHLDTTQTAWSAIKWNTLDEVAMSALIRTGSSVADTTIWYGLKLTNTPVVATDNNQAFFRYGSAHASYPTTWVFTYSVGGTDYEIDTGVEVTASTNYEFEISFDEDRFARGSIRVDGGKAVQFVSSVAMTTDTDLIPYVGVLTTTTAAKAITVRPGFLCSKTQSD